MVASAIAASLPALASAGASFGLSKLFGGKSKKDIAALRKPVQSRIDAGGFVGTGGRIRSTQERQDLVSGLQRTFEEKAGLKGGLREQVAPGFGRLTTSRLAQVERGRSRAIGNLRENLQRRRVLGSSFAGDALSRAEAGFAQQAEQVAGESFLQELQLSNVLLDEQFGASLSALQVQLDELNVQGKLAVNLQSGERAEQGANARALAKIAVQDLQGLGAGIVEPIANIAGNLAKTFFSNTAGATA